MTGNAAGVGHRVTVLIAARNAAATIERAVRSAVAQAPAAVVLVDDASEDDTADRAARVAPDLVHVERLDEHRTLGHARAAALARVATPFGIWLDADDEMLPERAQRLIARLEREGADIAADSVELIDHATGTPAGESRLPPFLFRPPGIVRLFERNYLPAPGPVAFRVDALRRVGYDEGLHGSEDVDLLLRAIASGLRFALVDQIGYRLYTWPNSLSRNIANQRAMLRTALEKHGYEEVERLYAAHGGSAYVTGWGLVWFATFRGDWEVALRFVERLAGHGTDPAAVVEPDGPCPRPEAWRLNFHRGTLLLLLDHAEEGREALTAAEAVEPTPEGANNLGVAMHRTGRPQQAREQFARALECRPGYVDATLNLSSAAPLRVTELPLRLHRARTDYPVSTSGPPPGAHG